MFYAGFYEADITPPMGVDIPGYFVTRKGNDVWDTLYAKAAVISDGKEKIAFLMIDKLFVSTEERDAIYERIEAFTDIKKENVILFATHTHNGGTSLKWSPNNGDVDALYIEMLKLRAADAVYLADKRLQKATLHYGLGMVNDVSFVRNFYMKDGNIRSNPGRLNPDIVRPISEIDPDFPILLAKDENGKIFGALAEFSLHNCCVGKTAFSSDYSGYMAKTLKKTYGQDFVCVFLNGFCGNLNHHDVTKPFDDNFKYYIPIGERLAEEFVRVEKAGLSEVKGEIRTIEKNITTKRRELPEEELQRLRDIVEVKYGGVQPEGYLDLAFPESPQMEYYNAMKILRLFDKTPVDIPVQLKVFKIGDCAFFASPCEMFNQFAQQIKEGVDTERNFIIELANGDPTCYVPIRELFGSTAYEAFYMSSRMVPDAGYIWADTLIEASKEI
ncbi:MAG: neutral/alkaline non-lysosomal ceramidase N-terminal domain-containing protein [Clostridia bacterium]|nr:neutral/alkaline non-lysosomal ceramidase N-terminal domain-containing protein [Clostridia bacterium]